MNGGIINYHYKVASCWLFLVSHTRMHGSMNIKSRKLCPKEILIMTSYIIEVRVFQFTIFIEYSWLIFQTCSFRNYCMHYTSDPVNLIYLPICS